MDQRSEPRSGRPAIHRVDRDDVHAWDLGFGIWDLGFQIPRPFSRSSNIQRRLRRPRTDLFPRVAPCDVTRRTLGYHFQRHIFRDELLTTEAERWIGSELQSRRVPPDNFKWQIIS